MSENTLRIFVLNVPEFAVLVQAARRLPQCRVEESGDYMVISADEPVVFERRALGVKPAIWYGLFTGGLDADIEYFERDAVRLVARA
jgi:hypothetical protein